MSFAPSNSGANSRTLSVVLAGGASRRMGRSKAELQLPDGRTLLERVVAELLPISGAVAISVAATDIKVRSKIAGCATIADSRKDCGPCAGVEAALFWAGERGFDWVLTLPVDLPFLPTPWLGQTQKNAAKSGALAGYLIARDGAEAQLCGAWSAHAAAKTSAYLNDGGRSVLGLHQVLGSLAVCASDFADWDAYPHALHNLNYPEDWEQAQAIMQALGQSPGARRVT